MKSGDHSEEHPIELAVVLPTFNESSNVDRVIATLDRVLAGISWEAVFVDDNSPDHTAQMLRDRAREDRRIRVIERLGRRGLSSACIEGMMATGAPLVAVMDADLQHDANLLPKMVAALNGDANLDIVVGSRFVEGGGTGDWDEARLRKSQFATRLGTKLLNLTLSDPSKFLLNFSLPTASASNPLFNANGYWKGSTWIDQVWFAYTGLKLYAQKQQEEQEQEAEGAAQGEGEELRDEPHGVVLDSARVAACAPKAARGAKGAHDTW